MQPDDARTTHMAYKLRQRLVWFSDILRSYLSETVIALCTESMTADMKKAEDIDEMSNIHIKHLIQLQEHALLSENLRPIHGAIISLLDLAVLFSETCGEDAQKSVKPKGRPKPLPKSPGKPAKALNRRKSFIPLVVENVSSDSSDNEVDVEDYRPVKQANAIATSVKTMSHMDDQFGKLLAFVTAGLKSVSRASAAPVWEMLAERLEWDKRKDKL
jgi:gamma-tubulin complex component 5